MWSKYVTRRLAVQVAQAWNFGWGEEMQKVYGLSVTKTLVFRDSQKTDYYVDEEEHKQYVAGLYKLLEDKNFLATFHSDAQKTLELILHETEEKFSSEFSEVSREELLKLYTDFILPHQTQFYIRMWTVFNIGEPLAATVKTRLESIVTDAARVTEYLLVLSTPLQPNDVLNERMALLKIAINLPHLSSSELSQHLTDHTAAFRHIPMFDFDHEPYDVAHFADALRDISNPAEELSMLEEQFREHQREYEHIVRGLAPSEEFLSLIRFLKENVFLRDYRDMVRQKLNLKLREFYTAVGHFLGLSVEEVALLTNTEITKYLGSDTAFPQEEVVKRKTAYLLMQQGSEAQIFSGEYAVERAKSEIGIGITSNAQTEVRGIVGSRGRVTGKAKIVFTNKDLSKVEQGDILIATMTRQDFVPAMRKAAGIVTDEGSITAHAAIIARELHIPCIVAAKNATSIFKDGDMVEVDAESGIMRKL